jgi:hypothetical protein
VTAYGGVEHPYRRIRAHQPVPVGTARPVDREASGGTEVSTMSWEPALSTMSRDRTRTKRAALPNLALQGQGRWLRHRPAAGATASLRGLRPLRSAAPAARDPTSVVRTTQEHRLHD